MNRIFSARDQMPEDEDLWGEDYGYEEDNEGDLYGSFMDDDTLEFKAGSARDFTGLIPSLPKSEAELESYADLYHYPGDITQD